MIDNKKKIWIVGISSLLVGAVLGRFMYMNYSEKKEGQQNFTPDVMNQITNGNPEILDEPMIDLPDSAIDLQNQQDFGYSQDEKDSETDPNYYGTNN